MSPFENAFYDYQPVGLSNLGNTCYMNAVLQALFNCPKLTIFYRFAPSLMRSRRSSLLSDKYTELILKLSDGASPVRPYEILDTMRSVNPSFRGFHQQDAQEFMRAFLYELHECLIQVHIPDLHFRVNRIKSDNANTEIPPEEPRTVIFDVFQGSLVSSVECLSCHRCSEQDEIFLDISVPLNRPRKSLQVKPDAAGNPGDTAEQPAQLQPRFFSENKGTLFSQFLNICFLVITTLWLYFSYTWQAPLQYFRWSQEETTFHLEDCLESFFSDDELNGENSYHCESCRTSCNGLKRARLKDLPEVLCVHLKRFRNDNLNASKLCTPVHFPLDDLDLSPYMHSQVPKTNSFYTLNSVICHVGTAYGCGHYITYAWNAELRRWFEYDDDRVRPVSDRYVLSHTSSAYVLIYSRKRDESDTSREEFDQLKSGKEKGEEEWYFISQLWVLKFLQFADPGPVTTHNFLCPHGEFQPELWSDHSQVVHPFSAQQWRFLVNRFGCEGPAVRELRQCARCCELLASLTNRRNSEMKKAHDFQSQPSSLQKCAISNVWFNSWKEFVNNLEFNPPGPIDNTKIEGRRGEQLSWNPYRQNYTTVTLDTWNYLHSIYGGGPKMVLELTNDYCRAAKIKVEEVDDDEDEDDKDEDIDNEEEALLEQQRMGKDTKIEVDGASDLTEEQYDRADRMTNEKYSTDSGISLKDASEISDVAVSVSPNSREKGNTSKRRKIVSPSGDIPDKEDDTAIL